MALFKALVAVLVLVVIPLLAVCNEPWTIQSQDEDFPLEKRIQAQSKTLTSMQALLNQLQRRIAQVETQRMIFLRGKPGIPGRNGQRGSPGHRGPRGSRGTRGYRGPGGVQYVRWGRTTCPWGASLVYKGRTGGADHFRSGGGSNYVCLPENPKYGRYKNGYQNTAFMYGTEYELDYYNPFTRNLHDHDAPCAVCHVRTRSAKMMIPATYECPAGWTREYHGYLMASKYYHPHSTTFICVDQHAEAVPGTKANRNGAQLYPVEGVCGSLPCYPYVGGRELTCAVCTK